MEAKPVDLDTFIVATYCLVDETMDELLPDGQRLRKRGPEPLFLDDKEVLTVEVVGEFLGLDTDEGLFRYFRRHYSEWFPGLGKVHRTTFVRQAANLWKVKRLLWRYLLREKIYFDPMISIIDSFPVPTCRFARAYRCRRLKEVSAHGHDSSSGKKGKAGLFFGLKAHVRVCWPGVVVEAELAAANHHDLSLAEEILGATTTTTTTTERGGWVLGDRNYHSPNLSEALLDPPRGLELVAPHKSSNKERHPWPRWLVNKRRRIETVFSQFVERFNAKKVWARDRWHLTSRFVRKILSHTIAVYFSQQAGLSSPLRFSELVID
jgi:hypothetical protein